MIVTRTYKFRLEPTAEQEHLFVVSSGCRRYVWNYALARKKAHYQQTGKTLSYQALASELVALKKQSDTAFLKGVIVRCCSRP